MLLYPLTVHLLYHRLMEECGIEMYCDLHAHSRKHNIFIYGCENRRTADRLQEQVFPLMLHKNAADKVLQCFTSKLIVSYFLYNFMKCCYILPLKHFLQEHSCFFSVRLDVGHVPLRHTSHQGFSCSSKQQTHLLLLLLLLLLWHMVVQLVEALHYKSEGHRFNSHWCHWNFSLT